MPPVFGSIYAGITDKNNNNNIKILPDSLIEQGVFVQDLSYLEPSLKIK
jgi:hypothetical protein